ncbi:MAG: hypothetical protein II237_05970 [Clostridia bacterium]|nr:hypothetical protein [Clostridia bacterium]
MKKRILAAIMAIMMMVSVFAPTASAASIASNKETAKAIRGGQAIYVTTNNTIFSKTGFGTDIDIYMSKTANNGIYDMFKATTTNARIKVEVYKKSGSKWVLYKTKTNCQVKSPDGFIVQVELPGKGVQYKIVVTPNYHSGCSEDLLKLVYGVTKNPKDLNGFWVDLDYGGKITKVA